MATAKKSDEAKSVKTSTILWVNCSLRAGELPNYGSYASNNKELQARLASPGEMAKIAHTFNGIKVKPFESIEMPADVDLRSNHTALPPSVKGFVRTSAATILGEKPKRVEPKFERSSPMHSAACFDSNLGFLPAAEEGEEIVNVLVVVRRGSGGPRFVELRYVPADVSLKREDVDRLRGRLPQGRNLDIMLAQANRKWASHPGAGRHTEEQAIAVMCAMVEEDTIRAYLRRDTRERVQKFGHAIANMRRLERADRGMSAVRRQRDASRMI